MINLNTNPEALLTVEAGQVVTLDGRQFLVDLITISNETMIHLTETSSPGLVNLSLMNDDDLSFDYESMYVHVRVNTGEPGALGLAAMPTPAMVNIIRNKTYHIK